MKVKLIGIFVCMLLVIGILPVSGILINEKTPSTIVNGKTLYVGGDGPGNYTRIQDAIENASDGDTIFVYIGEYFLDDFTIINVSIRLIGENKFNTVIYGWVIGIDVSNIEIRDFTFKNLFGLAVGANESNNIIISNNIFNFISDEFSFGIGIFISHTNFCTITDNTFFNCGLMIYSYHNTVYNNTVNGKPLLYLEGASDMVIDDAGQVILIDCNNITIKNLELSNTPFGIQLCDSENCLISENQLSNQFNSGLFLNSSNNIITRNIISNNIVGLGFYYSKCNKISKNSFENNDCSIFIIMSSNNLISYNNFNYGLYVINKNILSHESDNYWTGNFWDRPRLLPVLIWNFKIIKLRPIRIIPYSPDVDWRPARVLNEINGVKGKFSTQERNIAENKFITIPSLLNFLEKFSILYKLLTIIK